MRIAVPPPRHDAVAPGLRDGRPRRRGRRVLAVLLALVLVLLLAIGGIPPAIGDFDRHAVW